MTAAPAPDLVVVGGGIVGMLGARRAALGGSRVLLLEAGARLGGMLRRADLRGIPLDIGAEAFATRGGAFEALLEELGMRGDIVEPRTIGSWVVTDRSAAPSPPGGLLGIPGLAALDDPDTRQAVVRSAGDGVLAELERDRALEPLAGVDAGSLAELVLTRMGPIVLERLVAPVARGVYSLDPADLDHRALIPGLAERLQLHGSLAGAVADLRRAAPPGAAVRTVRGGMHRVIARLEAELAALGVEVRLGTRVTDVARDEQGWTLQLADGASLPASALLATVPLLPAVAGATVPAEVVAVLVRAPELDAFPRGTGVLVGEPSTSIRAKALTHVTAKWGWQQAAVEEGMHVLRLSYGPGPAQTGHAKTADLDDDALGRMALGDASRILGVELREEQLLALARHEWQIPAPAARLGRATELREARAAAAERPSLALAGTWIDGTGLASVVPGVDRAVITLGL